MQAQRILPALRALALIVALAVTLVWPQPDPAWAAGSIISRIETGYGPSLALDASGDPVVSYYDWNAQLKVLHCGDPNCAVTKNTQPGSNVQVPLGSGVTLIFDNVNSAGTTTLDVSTPWPPGTAPETGFIIWGLGGQSSCYDINTTASFSGVVSVCLTYDDTGLTQQQENNLTLKRQNPVPPGPPWTELANITVDKTNNIICGDSNTLSIFTVQLPGPVGGIAELPEVDGTALETTGSSGGNYGALAAVVGGAAGAVALGGTAWYVRRRRPR